MTRYSGRAHPRQIRSSVWTATVVACRFGAYAMGLLIDYPGGCGPSLGLFADLLVVGAIAGVFAMPPVKGGGEGGGVMGSISVWHNRGHGKLCPGGI